MPTRLLELSEDGHWVTLHPTNNHPISYMALSHAWGGEITFVTSKTSLANMLQGFGVEKLPQTLCDAVIFSHMLGIRYLWIDCLCIIQDGYYPGKTRVECRVP